MKKKLLLLALVVLSCSGPKQQDAKQQEQATTQQESSRQKIAEEILEKLHKEKMDPGITYEIVSYSTLDSLITSPLDDEYYQKICKKAIKLKEEAGIHDRDITEDITPLVEKMEKEPELYGRNTLKKVKAYQAEQQKILGELNKFVPKFIGWKMTGVYKFTEKNKTREQSGDFYFDKDLTKVVKIGITGTDNFEIID